MSATLNSTYQALRLQHVAGNPPETDPQRNSETFGQYALRMQCSACLPDINLTESDAAYLIRLASYNVPSTLSATQVTASVIVVNDNSTGPIEVVSNNVDNFSEINITNSTGSLTASADLVATNDQGNNNGCYVDMGINSSGYKAGFIGGPNESYLYSSGSGISGNLYIGNATPSASVYLFAGGYNNTSSVSLAPNGLFTTTQGFNLPVSTSLKTLTPITSTGSAYIQVNAGNNLLYVYNGTGWHSCSLA